MTVRSKMKFVSRKKHAESDAETIEFSAVCDDGTPENQKFARYTPNGRFEMYCNNPEVLSKLELGKSYYFDITRSD
jgi:hypothetical protein